MNLNEVVWKVDDTSVHRQQCVAKPFSSGTESKCQLCDTTAHSGHALTILLHNKRSQRHHFKREPLLKTLWRKIYSVNTVEKQLSCTVQCEIMVPYAPENANVKHLKPEVHFHSNHFLHQKKTQKNQTNTQKNPTLIHIDWEYHQGRTEQLNCSVVDYLLYPVQ